MKMASSRQKTATQVLLGFVPIFVAQMSMSLLIKPIMAEDALFAFIPGYPVRSPRFEVLRRLHAVDATRGHQTRSLVQF